MPTPRNVEHDLGNEDGFKKLGIDAETAGGAAALKGATLGFFVVGTVAAFRLDFRKPVEDDLEALPGVVGSARSQACHEVVVGEPEDGAAILDLAAPGNRVRSVPDVGIPFDARVWRGARNASGRCPAWWRCHPRRHGRQRSTEGSFVPARRLRSRSRRLRG